MKIRQGRGAQHEWRTVPLTDYEANLLRELSTQPPNVGTWRGKLLGQIAERFTSA